MEKFQSFPPHRLSFDLASCAESWKGSLYAEENVDKKYLPNGLKDIKSTRGPLSPDIQAGVHADSLAVLHKIDNLLRDAYGGREANTVNISTVIAEAARLVNEVRK